MRPDQAGDRTGLSLVAPSGPSVRIGQLVDSLNEERGNVLHGPNVPPVSPGAEVLDVPDVGGGV